MKNLIFPFGIAQEALPALLPAGEGSFLLFHYQKFINTYKVSPFNAPLFAREGVSCFLLFLYKTHQIIFLEEF